MEENYEIFYRNWWRKENNRLVPDPGADETHLGYAETEKEAREMCREWNNENDPGELSCKAEYRSL